jgi:hypothetical protein
MAIGMIAYQVSLVLNPLDYLWVLRYLSAYAEENSLSLISVE